MADVLCVGCDAHLDQSEASVQVIGLVAYDDGSMGMRQSNPVSPETDAQSKQAKQKNYHDMMIISDILIILIIAAHP
jgi:hypothetical protein